MNILAHISYDLLSSYSCASFATTPMSLPFFKFCRGGNVKPPEIYFYLYKSICRIFIVLVNILLHFRHDLLSSVSPISFARPLVSVS